MNHVRSAFSMLSQGGDTGSVGIAVEIAAAQCRVLRSLVAVSGPLEADPRRLLGAPR
jgi:hypothetical protein